VFKALREPVVRRVPGAAARSDAAGDQMRPMRDQMRPPRRGQRDAREFGGSLNRRTMQGGMREGSGPREEGGIERYDIIEPFYIVYDIEGVISSRSWSIAVPWSYLPPPKPARAFGAPEATDT
jgi:hypothetical protein